MVTPSVSAEFLCRSNVSYSWQRDKEMTKIMVFVGSFEAKGADEAAAKAALAERVDREKPKGSEMCLKEHENLTGCIASKISSLSTTMPGLTFSARKLLEDSIGADCKLQQGKCAETVSSDPVCVEKVVSGAGEGKDQGKEGGKEKDKKKK